VDKKKWCILSEVCHTPIKGTIPLFPRSRDGTVSIAEKLNLNSWTTTPTKKKNNLTAEFAKIAEIVIIGTQGAQKGAEVAKIN
jgi:hypothetical protein